MVDCKEEILKINHNLSTQIAQTLSHSATGDCVSNNLLLGKIKKKLFPHDYWFYLALLGRQQGIFEIS